MNSEQDALEALRIIAESQTPNQAYDFCDRDFANDFLAAHESGRTRDFLREVRANDAVTYVDHNYNKFWEEYKDGVALLPAELARLRGFGRMVWYEATRVATGTDILKEQRIAAFDTATKGKE